MTSTMQFDPKTVGYAERRLRVRNNGTDYAYRDELDVKVYEGLPSPSDGPSPARSVRPSHANEQPAKLVRSVGQEAPCQTAEAIIAGMKELELLLAQAPAQPDEVRRKYNDFFELLVLAAQFGEIDTIVISSSDMFAHIDPGFDVVSMSNQLHAGGDDDFENYLTDFED